MTSPAASNDRPIKVGLIVDQTGPLSFVGLANANVAKMVIGDINAKGGLLGREVKLHLEDSETSDAALTYGRALARNFHATLHVAHVVGNVSSGVYGVEGYVASMPGLQKEIEDAARTAKDKLSGDTSEPARTTETAPVEPTPGTP